MGTVEASTVRLSGETDKSYFERVNKAFTGKVGSGPFGIGMHAIRHIRFQKDKAAVGMEMGEEPAVKK